MFLLFFPPNQTHTREIYVDLKNFHHILTRKLLEFLDFVGFYGWVQWVEFKRRGPANQPIRVSFWSLKPATNCQCSRIGYGWVDTPIHNNPWPQLKPTNGNKQHKQNPQIWSKREVESRREREMNKRESKRGEGGRLSLRDERDNKNK